MRILPPVKTKKDLHDDSFSRWVFSRYAHKEEGLFEGDLCLVGEEGIYYFYGKWLPHPHMKPEKKSKSLFSKLGDLIKKL